MRRLKTLTKSHDYSRHFSQEKRRLKNVTILLICFGEIAFSGGAINEFIHKGFSMVTLAT